ncbi:vanin-like protein 1 [Teleopsis dalmanni]|uniref:vanin-like protein 1 n=2 Tax=Teleopsis dalmanni TaxID=139649 RepID=UPI0018CD3E89|nr:vanin-like protein 1 [Teleopsis dalmanni]
MSSADIVNEHLEAYVRIIKSAEANDTDIIVFPEGTLNNALQTTYVPAAHEKVVPCLNVTGMVYADFLMQLSCAARTARKYLVINLTEKENCTAVAQDTRPCAANGLNVYNTNVVFDREGCVISRYRKVHIYVEQKNTTLEPEYGIFETDFGVRFGHFICFDILFYTPAEELVIRYGIKDIIFTSMFYSELPFLTAVQLQQSWAWGNDVNVLAAGASLPVAGVTGTGIYAGVQGDLVSVIVGGVGIRKLYVSQVPIISNKTLTNDYEYKQKTETSMPIVASDELTLLKDPQIENFTSLLLDFTTQQNITQTLCNNDFCCRFDIATQSIDTPAETVYYKYRIGAFKGQRTYQKNEWSDIQICALYACKNESVASCAEIFNSTAVVKPNIAFKSLQIVGDFMKADKLLIMPNTLDGSLLSLSAETLGWHVIDQREHYTAHMNLTRPYCDSLLTFGIYANYYDRSATTRTASYSNTTPTVLLCTLALVLLVWRF